MKYDQTRIPEQATGAALQLFKETRVDFQPPESRKQENQESDALALQPLQFLERSFIIDRSGPVHTVTLDEKEPSINGELRIRPAVFGVNESECFPWRYQSSDLFERLVSLGARKAINRFLESEHFPIERISATFYAQNIAVRRILISNELASVKV